MHGDMLTNDHWFVCTAIHPLKVCTAIVAMLHCFQCSCNVTLLPGQLLFCQCFCLAGTCLIMSTNSYDATIRILKLVHHICCVSRTSGVLCCLPSCAGAKWLFLRMWPTLPELVWCIQKPIGIVEQLFCRKKPWQTCPDTWTLNYKFCNFGHWLLGAWLGPSYTFTNAKLESSVARMLTQQACAFSGNLMSCCSKQ